MSSWLKIRINKFNALFFNLIKYIMKLNGPINVIRLEGKIENINKVLYLFMDHHLDESLQTNCDDPNNSINIDEYFISSFKNLNKSDKKYDFFVEFHPSDFDLEPDRLNYKEKYLHKIWKLFYHNVTFNKDSNKINISDMFNNIRFHYIDIRAYIYIFIEYPFNYAITATVNPTKYIKNVLLIFLDIVKDGLSFIKKTLETSKGKQKNIADKIIYPHINLDLYLIDSSELKEAYHVIFYLLNKLNDYHHDFVKNKMREHIKQYINQVSDLISDLNDFYKRLYTLNENEFKKKENIKLIHDELIQTHLHCFVVIARLVDIYFLRRFLDKNYITNGIVYSGAAHIASFIHILINSFGFKLTHVAKSKIDNIERLETQIKKTGSQYNDNYDIMELFNVFDSKQCSDISSFPKQFL